jgi:Spy/CpxP family protein refolding chaperone
MKLFSTKSLLMILTAAGLLFTSSSAFGQRRDRLPNGTPEQIQAVVNMMNSLSVFTAAVAEARAGLATATFAEVKDEAVIRQRAEALREAEIALAMARGEAFARVQADPATRLTPEQIASLIRNEGEIRI